MSLLKERIYYKPFEYPWAFDAYDMQQKMHWLPSEVPLAEDVRDWNERLNKREKNLITQILKFFTQGDVDIAQAYLSNYIPKFKPPEIRMMLSAFATSEANHAHSYSLLNDTIGLPDKEFIGKIILFLNKKFPLSLNKPRFFRSVFVRLFFLKNSFVLFSSFSA